ncbi:MAG: DUF21 domain-containing protein [Gemmatirosa sp.]|nr:DUF21 domain-containing protein [Gemmatirosa sp.]
MSLVLASVLVASIVAVLTAAAIAVRSVSRIWLRHWVERRLRGASVAELYLERPQRFLSSAGIGIALTVFLAGATLGAADRSLVQVAWHVAVLATVVVAFGQLLPRAVARRWPALLVPVLVPLLRVVDAAVMPLRWAGCVLARPFRAAQPPAPADAARSDLEELLREGAREGVGESQEIAIITGVVQFGEKTVREVMTPRADVFAVPAGDPPTVAVRRIARSAYSRVPVYRESLDDVAGMVHAFDVLQTGADAWPPIRPVATALTTTPCHELLFSMLRSRRHLAIVRDASGTTVGIATLEDLLEELVGDIRDEHDEPPPRTP